jgi:hypothetical protein
MSNLAGSRWAKAADPTPTTTSTSSSPVEPQATTSAVDYTIPDAQYEEFAQTRAPDDLFDDDFTPISAEDIAAEVASNVAGNAASEAQPQTQNQSRNETFHPRGPRGGFNRGGGRGNWQQQQGPGGPRNHSNMKQFPGQQNLRGAHHGKPGPMQRINIKPAVGSDVQQTQKAKTSPDASDAAAQAAKPNTPPGTIESAENTADTDPAAPTTDTLQEDKPVGDATSATPSKTTPTGPAQPHVPPVRGDRSGTGGTPKPRLTEEQLSAKIAAMRIKNAELTARHDAMRQDEEAAAQREREDVEKRKVRQKEAFEKRERDRKENGERRQREKAVRDQMEGEREANRQRKLRGVKEWDVGKEEESGPPVRTNVRGEGGRGRGRGDGFRGGRGSGRGRSEQHGTLNSGIPDKATPQKQPNLDRSDFPALPASAAPTGDGDKGSPARKELTFPAQTAKALAAKSGKLTTSDRTKEDFPAIESPLELKPGEKKVWADMVDD